MDNVVCDEKTFQSMYDVFEKMTFTADDYTPTEIELKMLCDDLPRYMPFLLWIEDTGYDTDENIKMRKTIRQIIKNKLRIV